MSIRSRSPHALRKIHSGEDLLVIEKPAGRLQKYDVPLYRRDTGKYVLHRILKVRERDYYVVGDNHRRGESVKDSQILGVMTQVVRDGRTITAEDPAYRRYVRLWCDFFPIRAGIFFVRDGLRAVWRRIRKLWKRG